MQSIARLPVLVLACMIATTAEALAQARDSSSGTAQQLPTIEVTGSMLTRTSVSVGATTGIATRVIQPGKSSAAVSLADLVASVGNANTYDDLGSRLKPTFVLRGFAAGPVVGLPQGVSIFLDGVPVNEADAGQVNTELLPMDELRQLELFSSVTALLGPNSMGGSMNVVTRQAGDAFGAKLSIGGASYGGFTGHGSASGAVGNWRLLGSLASDEEEGWRQRTWSRVQRALLNGYRGSDVRNLRIQMLAAGSVAQTAGSLPESVFGVRPDSNLTGGDFEDITQLHFAVSGSSALSVGRVGAAAWYRDNSAQRFNVNQVNDPDVRSFTRTQTAGMLGDWGSEFQAGEVTVGVRSGIGASLTASQIAIYAERIDPRLTTQVRTPVSRFDLFTEASARRGMATLSGGLRLDAIRVPFRNLIDPERDTTSTFTALNPRAALALDLTRNLRTWAGVVRSFRAPAVIEIACADPEEPCPLPFALGDDPPISPVVAVTSELGASWRRGPVAIDATMYRTNVRDEIVLVPYEDEDEPEGSTIDGFFTNIPKTRRQGFDVSGQLMFRNGARLGLQASNTIATFQSGGVEIFSIREAVDGENEIEPGDRMPLVPEHRLTFRAESSPLNRVVAGWATSFTGKQWLRGDEANETTPLDGYWVSNAFASIRLGQWEVQGSIRNVFDAKYASFGTFNINQGGGDVLERFLTPGQARTISLTVSRRFGSSTD